jgi:hypothetical protein
MKSAGMFPSVVPITRSGRAVYIPWRRQPAPVKPWRRSVMPWSIRKNDIAEYYLNSSQTWNVPIIMTLEEVLCLILLTR